MSTCGTSSVGRGRLARTEARSPDRSVHEWHLTVTLGFVPPTVKGAIGSGDALPHQTAREPNDMFRSQPKAARRAAAKEKDASRGLDVMPLFRVLAAASPEFAVTTLLYDVGAEPNEPTPSCANGDNDASSADGHAIVRQLRPHGHEACEHRPMPSRGRFG